MTPTATMDEQAGSEVRLTDFPPGITISLLDALSPLRQYWQDGAFSFAQRGSERALVFRLESGTRDVALLAGEEGTWVAFKASICDDLPQATHAFVLTKLATGHPELELKLEPVFGCDSQGNG